MGAGTAKEKRERIAEGAAFQRLVGAIENSIVGTSGFTIEVSKRLRDRDTGRLREHDVVLTHRHAHHETITAIECRDRSRRIGVPDVEQFYKKCDRTGVHRAMMVSKVGFTKTALSKAIALDIECLNLEDTDDFRWCLMRHATVQNCNLHSGRFLPFPEPPGLMEMELFAKPNIRIDQTKMNEILHFCINNWRNEEEQEGFGRKAGRYLVTFNLQGTDYYLIDKAGQEYAIERMTVLADFELIDLVSPLKFSKYAQQEGGAIAEVASAKLDFGGRTGQLMFVSKPGEATDVLIAFD